jgi:Family of unknown function (DUF5985)
MKVVTVSAHDLRNKDRWSTAWLTLIPNISSDNQCDPWQASSDPRIFRCLQNQKGWFMMAALVYSLCALTALFSAYLLLQAYRRGGYRLLLWSGLCFVGLTLNNLLLVLDKLILPEVDLSIWRTSVALAAMTVLLYGLIWDSE